MMKRVSWLLAILSIALAGLGREKSPSRIHGLPNNYVTLDQGWKSKTIQKFWFTGQGSELIPRDWMRKLRRPNGDLFATPATFARYRYLPVLKTKYNEDGWPVGFAVSKNPRSKVKWLGYTCAACHTGRVDYNRNSIILTGGATLANLSGLLGDLIETMQATVANNAAFERFALEVLGYADRAARDRLRDEMASLADELLWRKNGMVDSGYGRLDAFGTIFNQVLANDLELPENERFADAPVSYPFIWDAPHMNRVQWNGAVSNSGPAGPIGRNVAEAMGVFGRVDIDTSRKGGYRSSIHFEALGDLEHWLKKLVSPRWPEEILPRLDTKKVERGKEVYKTMCARCHEVLAKGKRTKPGRKIIVWMEPIGAVGTDPLMATNFADRMGRTGRLKGHREYYNFGNHLGTEEHAMSILNNVAVGVMRAHPLHSADAALKSYEGFFISTKYNPIKHPAYKARPLNGIWATAPYLHNGSVPNLWELLLPPDRRSKSFHVGSFNFDPVNVGFETGPAQFTTLFDATGRGNSNAGHTYGTQLPDYQKWELIEYLKSL